MIQQQTPNVSNSGFVKRQQAAGNYCTKLDATAFANEPDAEAVLVKGISGSNTNCKIPGLIEKII